MYKNSVALPLKISVLLTKVSSQAPPVGINWIIYSLKSTSVDSTQLRVTPPVAACTTGVLKVALAGLAALPTTVAVLFAYFRCQP